MLGKVSMRFESESTFQMHSLLAYFSVFVILKTTLEIVAFWSLKVGLSKSAKSRAQSFGEMLQRSDSV